jgi:formylglycine-generating enzyme required for sulfatase activity
LVIVGNRNAAVLDPIAWYGGNCGVDFDLEENGDVTAQWPEKQHEFPWGGTRGVREKKPNPFGLHDMLGNVYEWSRDADGVAHVEHAGVYRVVRGGDWRSLARNVRAAMRDARLPNDRSMYVGFRLARDANPDKPKQGSG